MSLGADLIGYLGGLTLAGGDHDGEAFDVLPWERRFLRGAFRDGGDAALALARGNGKSCLVAGIACAVVDPLGPLHGTRAEVVCVASSFDQSRIVFEDVLAFLWGKGYDLENRDIWRKQDSANRAHLEFKPSGARVRCIGSDPRRAHGLRPKLVLADEPAQWPHESRDAMYSALRTGLGKVPGSKLIGLGTRPADAEHFFAKLLGSAPYSQVHAARTDDPPFRLATLRKANPSLDHLPSLRAKIAEEIADAKADPDALASYQALRLNQGVPDVVRSVLVDVRTWRRASELGATAQLSVEYVLGIDLGGTAAMSAAAAFHRSGELEAVACFPKLPGLGERGLADGVGNLYARMAERGELIQEGERVSDVAALLLECLGRWGVPAAVVADRWRADELADALEAARVPPTALHLRGMGFKDGAEDVRDFRRAVLGGHVRPEESLLLTAAMSEARTLVDPAGNHKLATGSQAGRRRMARDDAAAAAVLAVGLGFRLWHRRPERRRRPRRTALAG